MKQKIFASILYKLGRMDLVLYELRVLSDASFAGSVNLEIDTPMIRCFKLQLETANFSSLHTAAVAMKQKIFVSILYILGRMDLVLYELRVLSDASFAGSVNLELDTPMDWCFKLQLETASEARFTPQRLL